MKKLILTCLLMIIGFATTISLTACTVNDLQNELSLLSANSAIYTCTAENYTNMTHAHSSCDFNDCNILNNHNHENYEQCTQSTCTDTRPHQHGNCGIDGCKEHNTHAHGQDKHRNGSHSHSNGSHH